MSTAAPHSSVELGTRYALLRNKFRELESRCESAERENSELRGVMVQVLDQKSAHIPAKRGVQCDLLEYAGQHALQRFLAAASSVGAGDDVDVGTGKTANVPELGNDQTNVVEISALVRENRRLLSVFSEVPILTGTVAQQNQARADFSLYMARKRESTHYSFDCTCLKNQDTHSVMGHLLLFKDHLEFITPSHDTPGQDWDLFLLDLDEIGSISETSPPDKQLVFATILESQPQLGTSTKHVFWDVSDSGFEQLVHRLKEQLVIRHLGETLVSVEDKSAADTLRGVVVYENERKAVGWSGKFLLPGDVPNWLFVQNKVAAAQPPSRQWPAPPRGCVWASQDWTVDTDSFVGCVAGVMNNSPAALSGVQVGDLVLRYRSRRSTAFSLSYAALSYALEASASSTLELVLFRPTSREWVHAFLRPHGWEGQGFGLGIDPIQGWEYARSFAGPWSTTCKWTHYVRRRRWVRYAERVLEPAILPTDTPTSSGTAADSTTTSG